MYFKKRRRRKIKIKQKGGFFYVTIYSSNESNE